MKFERFRFMYDKNWIFVLPTITIIRNEQIYRYDNISITVHWLCWHFKWQWMKGEQE